MNPIEEKAEKYAEGAWPAQVNAYERGGRVGARNGYLAGHAAALSEHEGEMEKAFEAGWNARNNRDYGGPRYNTTEPDIQRGVDFAAYLSQTRKEKGIN